MLIAAYITYSPQMLKEVTSLQNSSTIIVWAFQSQSRKQKQLPVTEAQFQRHLHLQCCEYVQSEAQIFVGMLNGAWTYPPLLLSYVAPPFLFVSFFFLLEKKEPQKLDPASFLWLQRRHRHTLRGRNSIPVSVWFLRLQVFWIVLGSKPVSLRSDECPSAYRSYCRNALWTDVRDLFL